MGRRRIGGNPLGLEKRVYWHHGQFYYIHRDARREPLGSDIAKANERARVYNDPLQRFGTVGYYLDLYIAKAKAGQLLRKKSPRTIRDYEVQAPCLKVAFDKNHPLDLVEHPNLIADYRDNRTAKVRANRELSMLSAMYSWLIETGDCPGLKTNPVLAIARNPEKQKERYVEDAEYNAVYSVAQRSVCMAMVMVYRTLQRPADVLKMLKQDLRIKTVAGDSVRVLSVDQGKRDRHVDIKITPDLEQALAMLDGGDVVRLSRYLVHDLKGDSYTVDGIGAMVRRYCVKAGVKTFGLMDVRAKGATDMYLAGVPLEHIQQLMAHKSKQTTEIYIKRLLQTISIATPNAVQLAG